MPHSSPNAVHSQQTPGSPHTSKLLKLSAGVLSTSTNAPRTLLLEQKPWSLVNLKSATHRYHTLITAAKKKYYSSLIHSSSTNPRHLWRAVNSLLHRKSSFPLPSSIPSPSIADTFCSFFSHKISSLRFTLQSLLDSHATSTDSLPSPAGLTPPITHPSLPILFPASEAEVSLLLNSLPNKQYELDPIPTSLLKDCASVLVPVITKIINLSLSSGNFP